MEPSDIRDSVKEKYGAVAKAAAGSGRASCCGSANANSCGDKDPITRDLYTSAEAEGLPTEALNASMGCGNPTALLELRAGETVLDLGSGGGIDVLLSARRVGPTGKAYGLDMTPEMLALARENQAKARVTNVEFLEGSVEAVPLPDKSVDVVISNCVINLSPDKRRVLEEAFRVLRPGGRFAVSDVVLRRELPPAIKRSMELWTGCVAGALSEQEYTSELARAGFTDISVHATRVFGCEDVEEMARSAARLDENVSVEAAVAALDGAVISAFVRATKP